MNNQALKTSEETSYLIELFSYRKTQVGELAIEILGS